jgi:hypothetical protein
MPALRVSIGASGYNMAMTRTAPLAGAVALAAILAVGASSATRPPLTQASSGKTMRVAKGGSMMLRLSNRWRWEDPTVSSKAVRLSEVNYLIDPGFREWVIQGHKLGRATIRSVGKPNCSTCALATRNFRVTIVVGSG